MTLKNKFSKVEKHLIGLWKFREYNKPDKWCATFHINGFYYDIEGNKDIDETIELLYKKIQYIKKRKRSRKTL
jgi:hypothetical protein